MKFFPLVFNTPGEILKGFEPSAWADFFLSVWSKRLSTTEIRGQVLEVVQETQDTKTFRLKPNWLWKGFTPGQHVPVTVEIGGRRTTRYYSLSSDPKEKTISITVKRQPGGVVSNFLNETIQVGDVFELGTATGDFVVEPGATKLLFLAGGSGITPIHSILKSLESNQNLEMVLLYFVRSSSDVIFRDSLLEIQKKARNLKIHFIYSEEKVEGVPSGFFRKDLLEQLVPNWKEYSAFVCGPAPLQNLVRSTLVGIPLKSEVFLLTSQNSATVKKENKITVTLTESHRTLELPGERSLLEELEAEGIYPPSGCRMGICHTCVCKKTVGSVTDMSNEKRSGMGEENIQICVSRAESDLELEL